jgi:hypothetical protein
MKQLNTLPIEDFLEKTRVAIKTNQRNLTLSIKEATDLQNSLSMVMTRLAGNVESSPLEDIKIEVNGGQF